MIGAEVRSQQRAAARRDGEAGPPTYSREDVENARQAGYQAGWRAAAAAASELRSMSGRLEARHRELRLEIEALAQRLRAAAEGTT